MTRARGTILLRCQCKAPILAVHLHLFEDRERKMTSPFSWYLDYMREPGLHAEVKGRCRQCKRFLHATFPNSYKDFYESVNDLLSEEELPEWSREKAIDSKFYLATIGGYAEGRDEAGNMSYYPVIEIVTPALSIVPSSERKKQKEKPQIISDIPTPYGFRTDLKVNSPEKRHFVFQCRTAERWKIADDLFPRWREDASDAQFAEWADELEQRIKQTILGHGKEPAE